MYKVKLKYFKPSGKYYSHGSDYLSGSMHHIISQVKNLQREGMLPGLVADSGDQFIIYLNVPKHPENFPYIIIPETLRSPIWK